MGKWVWNNDIELYSEEQYDKAIDCLVERLSELSNVTSIYRFGNISAPGVSDLDVIVILEGPPCSKLYEAVSSVTFGSEKYSYLWTHMPLVMPEKIFSQVRWIHTSQKLSRWWGKEITVENIPAEVKQMLDLANYQDFTFSFYLTYLQSLNSQADSSPIVRGLRREMLQLNSLRHSLIGGASIIGQPAPIVCEDISSSRRDVSQGSLPDPEQVCEIAKEGLLKLREMDFKVYTTAIELGLIRRMEKKRELEVLGHRIIFTERLKEKGNEKSICLPPSYQIQFGSYGLAKGALPKMHRQLYGASFFKSYISPDFASVLTRRITIAERLFKWQRTSGFKPLVPLGTVYQTPMPLTYRVELLLKRLSSFSGSRRTTLING